MRHATLVESGGHMGWRGARVQQNDTGKGVLGFGATRESRAIACHSSGREIDSDTPNREF